MVPLHLINFTWSPYAFLSLAGSYCQGRFDWLNHKVQQRHKRFPWGCWQTAGECEYKYWLWYMTPFQTYSIVTSGYLRRQRFLITDYKGIFYLKQSPVSSYHKLYIYLVYKNYFDTNINNTFLIDLQQVTTS